MIASKKKYKKKYILYSSASYTTPEYSVICISTFLNHACNGHVELYFISTNSNNPDNS